MGVLGIPLKRPKKGCFGPFGGPYGGIPKVFGGGTIGALRGKGGVWRRKKEGRRVARADKGLS